jgi:hypothetical protein
MDVPTNEPVLCIPRVYPNINEERIRRVFNELNMGLLDRIDIIKKETAKGEKFNKVYIHFYNWNNTENARIARERLLNGKEIKVIYDDPWFWKISAYKKPEKHTNLKKNTTLVSKEEGVFRTSPETTKRGTNSTRRSGKNREQQQKQQSQEWPDEEEEYHPYGESDREEDEPIDYGNLQIPKRRYKKKRTTTLPQPHNVSNDDNKEQKEQEQEQEQANTK